MKSRTCALFASLGLIVILIWSSAACALERDFQTWINVTAIGKFYSDDKVFSHLRYWLEGQQRFGADTSRYSQVLLRPGLGYALTENTSIWLGYAWAYTGVPYTSHPFEENRIWQQLLWVKSFPAAVLSNRIRTEQRFLENNPKTAYRFRELVKVFAPVKTNARLALVASNEVFFHANNFVGKDSRGFDQNRFFVGLGYKVSPIAITEIGYMNQYLRRFGVPNFFADILAINVYFSL
jgi:hypothetical protein